MTPNISTLKAKSGKLSWINIINAKGQEIGYLKRKFKFNELDLKDSYAARYAQRPKFYNRNGYCFLILQFPVYDATARTIEPEEIDFFIGPDYLITIHKNNLPPLAELYDLCAADSFYKDQYLETDNSAFLYEIIVRLQEYCYPMLDHISLDIKKIEKNIFAGQERQMVTEILYIKRNILNFRKIMEAHKNAIRKIVREENSFFSSAKMKIYYHDLVEHTKNIWDILESHKQMIEALEETNTSLLSFKLNDIMRVLTVFSVLFIPLTLLASIFGMNAVSSMPLINDSVGFWKIAAIMLVCALVMFLFFKRKKWL